MVQNLAIKGYEGKKIGGIEESFGGFGGLR